MGELGNQIVVPASRPLDRVIVQAIGPALAIRVVVMLLHIRQQRQQPRQCGDVGAEQRDCRRPFRNVRLSKLFLDLIRQPGLVFRAVLLPEPAVAVELFSRATNRAWAISPAVTAALCASIAA